MLALKQIQSAFQSIGASLYETYFTFDEEIDIVLKSENVQELVALAKENNLKSVFYSYQYANIDDYLVSEDELLDIDDVGYEDYISNDAKERVRYKIAQVNHKVHRHNFSKPIALAIYCVLNGVQIGILQKDCWCCELPNKEVVLSELKDMLDELNSAAIESKYAEQEARCKEILNLILEHFDNTDEWYSCTNQRLRRNYCLKIVNEYEEKYSIRVPICTVSDELEIKWNEYKASKAKKS